MSGRVEKERFGYIESELGKRGHFGLARPNMNLSLSFNQNQAEVWKLRTLVNAFG